VHAHWILPSGLIGVFCKRVFRIPLVVTAHAGDVFPLKNTLLRSIGGFVLNNSDAVTANSRATKEAILEVNDKIKNKLDVIPMGVDIERFSSKTDGSGIRSKFSAHGKVVLFLGRLVEKKGVGYLIEAMPDVVKNFAEAKLLICGDGPLRDELEKQVSEVGISENVVFVGAVSNKETPSYYAACDVFVLPSIVGSKGDTEGLGVVLLEAMASGKPVIASNVGGIIDVIKDGETGLLVEQKNPKKLAEAINIILQNEKLASEITGKSEQRIKSEFSWEIIARKFKNIYDGI